MASEPNDPSADAVAGARFSRAPGTEHLPAPTVADLAELDAPVDAMVAQMQTPAARQALKKAFATRPKVRLDTEPRQG
jgi:hypothetical protein